MTAAFLPITTVVLAYIVLVGAAWLLVLVILRRFGARHLVRESA